MSSYFKICNASIHLVWIDCCPNGVVEAIAAGLPVITNNVGGTQEIVSLSGGFVCDVDNSWDMKPCDLYNPPPVKREGVISALKHCSISKPLIKRQHIDIIDIAEQYKMFMEKMCEKNY